MTVYLTDATLSKDEGYTLAVQLLEDRNLVKRIFNPTSRYDHPTIDALMHYFTNKGIKDPLEIINNALESCKLHGLKVKKADITENIKQLIQFKDGMILLFSMFRGDHPVGTRRLINVL